MDESDCVLAIDYLSAGSIDMAVALAATTFPTRAYHSTCNSPRTAMVAFSPLICFDTVCKITLWL